VGAARSNLKVKNFYLYSVSANLAVSGSRRFERRQAPTKTGRAAITLGAKKTPFKREINHVRLCAHTKN